MLKSATAIPNKYLVEERLKRKLLQKEVANQIGTTAINISRWESGITMPNAYFRRQLSLFFDKSEQELGLASVLMKKKGRLRTNSSAVSVDSSSATNQLFLPAWNICYKRNSLFTGREKVLNQLYTTFNTRNIKITIQALCGIGGIGKTQVALEYAYRYAHEYQTVLGVRATNTNMLLSDCIKMMRQLDVFEKEKWAPESVFEAIRNWLNENTRWLLIVDDIEDLNLLHLFLPSTFNGHVLLTTARAVAAIIAQPIYLEPMEREEGMYFLLRRAGILNTHTSLETIPTKMCELAAEIVHLLDGHALALDQAGAYIEESACTLGNYLYTYQYHGLALLSLRGTATIYHPESVTETILSAIERARREYPPSIELLWTCVRYTEASISEKTLVQNMLPVVANEQQSPCDILAFNASIKALRLNYLLYRDACTKTISIPAIVKKILRDIEIKNGIFDDYLYARKKRKARTINE